jgi:hypothetical protein
MSKRALSTASEEQDPDRELLLKKGGPEALDCWLCERGGSPDGEPDAGAWWRSTCGCACVLCAAISGMLLARWSLASQAEPVGLVLVPPEAATCAAYGCVDYASDNACQCSSSCEGHGNCCRDYFAVCAPGACAVHGCSLGRRPHGCQCHPGCAHDGDCCPDYVDTCRGRAAGIVARATLVTLANTTASTTAFLAPVSTTTTGDPHAGLSPLEDVYPAPAAGLGGYALFDKGENPLRIRASAPREANYFLLLGDWGTPGAPGGCQLAVADAMKQYAAEQRAAGMNLLFIGTVGDNFYWTGVQPQSWGDSWATPYGVNDPTSPLFQVPWLASLGNHDYGNDDAFAFCPSARPQFSVHGQSYASMQLNRDRNPSRPHPSELNTTHYWLPEYSYHYSIPEADVEVIAFDTNAVALDVLGGDVSGHKRAFARCGGRKVVEAFLNAVEQASMDLLVRRAREGTARTVVLLQHYPGQCRREAFLDALPEERRGLVRVLCAYGHVHDQKCEGWDSEGTCDTVMTGGGGGCCNRDVQAGFTAVRLTEGGGFEVDVDSAKVKLPANGCKWKPQFQLLQHV